MIRYLVLAIPYLLQLLCIVHVMKTGREFYWIWIILLLPYVGGLAYLIVEILPGLRSRRNLRALKSGVADVLAPGKKLESLRNKASYSPTVDNKLEYADALAERGEYEVALTEYRSCLTGLSKNNPAILYRTALTLFRMEDYQGAADYVARLPKAPNGAYEQKAWNALYLFVLENTQSEDAVSAEYDRISALLNDREIDLQYLEYLERIGDAGKLSSMLERIRVEEASLRQMNVRYDRAPYRRAYEVERRVKSRKKSG